MIDLVSISVLIRGPERVKTRIFYDTFPYFLFPIYKYPCSRFAEWTVSKWFAKRIEREFE